MSSKVITFVAIFAAMFAVWLTFSIYYAVSTGGQWRRTPEGRHLMSLAVVFVWNTALILLNVVLGQYPGRFVVQVVSYSAFVLVGIQRIVLLVRAQRACRLRRLGEAAMMAQLRQTPDVPRG